MNYRKGKEMKRKICSRCGSEMQLNNKTFAIMIVEYIIMYIVIAIAVLISYIIGEVEVNKLLGALLKDTSCIYIVYLFLSLTFRGITNLILKFETDETLVVKQQLIRVYRCNKCGNTKIKITPIKFLIITPIRNIIGFIGVLIDEIF